MQLTRTSLLVPTLVIGCLLATTLAGVDRLAFRDASHFYAPLYDYVSARQRAQWLPLWNPLDQTGVPLAGETTTAVFYPLRIAVFCLPLASETALAWYIALHLMIASLSAGCAARWSGATRSSAVIAATIYPLSGSVLFLYSNPPFLVGAAWMPLVLGPLLSRLAIPARRRVLISGSSLAMMILGGDPQTAVHAVIAVGLIALLRLGSRQRRGRLTTMTALVGSIVLGAVLSAPQLAASLDWSRQSDRVQAVDEGPRFAPPRVGSRRHQAFQYSLPPWHVAEVLSPSASGSLFPINCRVSTLMPGDGLMWTPTIYMSMLGALAVGMTCWREVRRRAGAWFWIGLIAMLLSWGHFGAVWVAQNMTGLAMDWDSAIGGPAWFLYEWLPGYSAFRYPTKWLPFVSLSTAIVAAQLVDRDIWRNSARLWPVVIVVLSTLLVASVLVFVLRQNVDALVDPQSAVALADDFWGPLQLDAGWEQVQFSLIHSLFALGAIVLLFKLAQFSRLRRTQVAAGLVVILAVDLGLAGQPLIAMVNRDREQRLIAASEQPTAGGQTTYRWMRTKSGDGWPHAWSQSSDSSRILDVESSARRAWFGRWHLRDRQRVFNNMSSIQSRSMAMFWIAARRSTENMSAQQIDQFWHRLRRWLGIDGVVHTTGDSIKVPDVDRIATLVDVRRRHSAAEVVRFYPYWQATPSDDLAAMEDLLETIGRREGDYVPRLHDLASDLAAPIHDSSGAGTPARVIVTSELAESLRVEVECAVPGVLTRPTFQDGNWVAEIATSSDPAWHPLTVHRVDFLKQGVVVPAGAHTIRIRYQPKWTIPLIAVAMLGWLCWLASILKMP